VVLLASCVGLVDVNADADVVPTNAARDCDLPTLLGAKATAVNGSKQEAAPMDQSVSFRFIFWDFLSKTCRGEIKPN
jgi:hypothetical protein